MSVEDLFSLRVAEALLAVACPSHSELAGPGYVDVEPDEGCSDDAASAQCVEFFLQLLGEEARFERDLLESGKKIDVPVGDGLVFVADDDMHVSCVECAVVDDGQGGRLCIQPSGPLVDGLVRAGVERPLGDQVRVFACLVRLGCKLVGRHGGFSGFLGGAVGRLRELVALMRLEQGDDAGDAAGRAHGTDDQVEDFDSVHGTDSRPVPDKEGV